MRKLLLSMIALLSTMGAMAQTQVTSVSTDKIYTLECNARSGHTTRFINDNGSLINGQSATGTLFTFETTEENDKYYIKSFVSGKYINYTSNGICAATEATTKWVTAKLPDAETMSFKVDGTTVYLNNNGTASDGTCTNLRGSNHGSSGPTDANNGCSSWIIREYSVDEALNFVVSIYESYTAGTLVGEYSEEYTTALANVIAEAREIESPTLDDIKKVQNDLAAVEVTRNMPVPGKFYQLAAWKQGNEGKVAFAKTDNKCYWGFNETPAAVWVFESADNGAYYLKNLGTGSYMENYTGSASGANVLIEKDETKTVAVAVTDDGRKVGIKVGNNIYLDRDQYNPDANGSRPVCHWTDNAIPTGDNRKWLINEVSASDIKHTLSVGATGWATLVLGFNATIPATEGVTVYAVESTSATEATLKPVTGVLPANTAVLVNAPAGTPVDFYYTEETATVSSQMTGTLYDKNITPEAGQTCYVLSNQDGVTAFYKATLNQAGNAAFKNNANKAYLPVATSAGAPSLNFVFDTETSIEGVEAAKAGKSAIYDLSGRRVKSAVKGIYIINGKKVVK